MLRAVEPAAEPISEARRFSRLYTDFIGFKERRRGIAGTLAVFPEDQPVTRRRIGLEDRIGRQDDLRTRGQRRLTAYSRAVYIGDRTARGCKPALEVLVFTRRIRSGNLIRDGVFFGDAGFDIKDDAFLARILKGDADHLEDHRVIILDCAALLVGIGDAAGGEHRLDLRADVSNVLTGGTGVVIVAVVPPAERLTAAKLAGARIIEHLCEHFSIDGVSLLDIDRNDIAIGLMEVDLHTRVFTGLDHDVYGEVLCREADRFIVGGYGRHKLAAVAALVIDLQRLSIAERIIRDGDRDRFLRLPALTVLIENGDIIGSEHRLIGRGGAGGALGGSSTIDALENHLRLGCALLDSGHAAAYRQNAVNTDIASGQSLLFGLDGLLGGGLFSRGCRDLDQTDTGGRIAHRNGREIVFAGDDLQLAALHTAVQRDESKRLALFKRRHRLDADSQLEILAVAADRPAFKNGTSLDGSDGNALQLGRVLIGGIAALCHSDGIFALALVAVRYVDGLFALDDGLFGGLGCRLGRRLSRGLGRRLSRGLGRRLRRRLSRGLGRWLSRGLGRRLSRGLGRRLRSGLRKLGHAVLCVSAVVQSGSQGLIAGPQHHQQGKEKREYAFRQFVHQLRASYY